MTEIDLLVGGLLVPIIGAMIRPRGTTAGALASIALGSALVPAARGQAQ